MPLFLLLILRSSFFFSAGDVVYNLSKPFDPMKDINNVTVTFFCVRQNPQIFILEKSLIIKLNASLRDLPCVSAHMYTIQKFYS